MLRIQAEQLCSRARAQLPLLTAVLADAINLALTRMADACAVATYRQLAWTAG